MMLLIISVDVPRPPPRPWITLGQPNRTKPALLFTVMCYNVLCEKLATRQLYGYCPPWALQWEHRKKNILEEIRHNSADIICLQEVATEQFYTYFLPQLQIEGYDGIFSPKSRAKTMSESERKHVDGCAIFFRKRKFTLVKKHLVEFNQLAMANAEGSDDMLNRVMTKDNIGLAAILQTKEAAFDDCNPSPDPSQMNQQILVCTAHIHWDPEYCDVKLIQTMMLMHELRTTLEDVVSLRPGATKTDPNSIPLILCGDLNSLPDSGVIEFLSTGRIPSDHADFKELGYKDALRKLSANENNKNELTHPSRIASAYETQIMPYTNYTFDFKGHIDYVFYSKQHMSVMGLLGPLDQEWLKENKVVGFPHPFVPSDHFSLLVEMELTL